MSDKIMVRGFTLAELIIALLLGSILVAVSYTAYRYVNRNLTEYRAVSTDISETYRSIGIVEQEAWNCDSATATSDTVIFYRDAIITMMYQTNGQYVVSRRGYTDTLSLKRISAGSSGEVTGLSPLRKLVLSVSFEGEDMDIIISLRP